MEKTGQNHADIILDTWIPMDSAGHSSKGNQWKWRREDRWYKADHMGYEGLAETVVSRLMAFADGVSYVSYEPVRMEYKGKIYNGCSSRNFLQEDEELVTVEHLFRQYTGKSLSAELGKRNGVKERILYLSGRIEENTGLKGFGIYLQKILAVDAFFLNEDRHTNNLAVIYRPWEKRYRFSPLFDHGLSLLSDTETDFPLGKPLEECLAEVEAKPFSRDFDEQLDAAEELYGCNVKFRFGKKEVENVLEECGIYYSKETVERVREILYGQMRKYRHMMDGNG